MTPTDQQLADQPDSDQPNLRQNESASELVRRFLPQVRRIVFPMVLDHEEADDLTQDIMIKAIGGLNGFKGEASLSTWVTRIALNTTYTYLQQRKRRSVQPLPASTIDKSFDHSPVHAAMGSELDVQIRASLQELSPKLRAAMVLTAIHGVSPNEAAEIESCSVSTMHWRIHEARKQLRHRLKEYVNTEDGEQ